MTVCIAATCADGVIFCAADRMLTAGDIQYEPPSPKIRALSKHIVSMMSGDAAFYTEIVDAVQSRMLSDNSTQPLAVQTVADLFVHYRAEAARKRAEAKILAPLGLTSADFIARQAELHRDLVDKLATELINFYVPPVDVIVTGIDAMGPQIFTIADGEVSCNNAVGFASVGSGSRHAESQFMLARHAFSSPAPDTAFLTYIAKKRSEVAPGVGVGTDMAIISQGDAGGVSPLKEELVKKLESTYKSLMKKEQKSLTEALSEVARYVASLTQAPTKEGQEIVGKSASADDASG